ncbi:MAG: iron-regulated protein [Chryseobacterium sp.]|nr:MAG: iron-regulated protein [Chryseobacterium sp.]
MRNFLLLFLVLSVSASNAQEFQAFTIYNKKGRKVAPDAMVKNLANYDVVLVGELHNNSINHWLQLRLTKALYRLKNGRVILGAEMFERDNQDGLNAYLEGKISAVRLSDSVRLWTNFKTDYKPLLDFAKEHRLKFIATNVPRKYASLTAKQGITSLDTLRAIEKRNMAPLPIKIDMKTPGYTEMLTMMGDHAGSTAINFVAAQAIKDATMAESILQNLVPGTLFIHYNGNYHSKEYGGIYWYLKQKRSNLRVAVLSVEEADNIDLPFPEKDFVATEYNLVVPADMTKTY